MLGSRLGVGSRPRACGTCGTSLLLRGLAFFLIIWYGVLGFYLLGFSGIDNFVTFFY